MIAISLRTRLQSSPPPEHPALQALQTFELLTLQSLLTAGSSNAPEPTEAFEHAVRGTQGPLLVGACHALVAGDRFQAVLLVNYRPAFRSAVISLLVHAPELEDTSLLETLVRASMWGCYHDGYNQLAVQLPQDRTDLLDLFQHLGFKPFDPADLA